MRVVRSTTVCIFLAGFIVGIAVLSIIQTLRDTDPAISYRNKDSPHPVDTRDNEIDFGEGGKKAVDKSECLSWIVLENTQVFGGIANKALTIEACRMECLAHPGCDGFDWDSVGTQSAQCWLSGAWIFGWNNKTAAGVSHYSLVDNCNKAQGNVQPAERQDADLQFFNDFKAKDQPKENADCIPKWTWMAILNTKVLGGLAKSVVTLSACHSACIVYPGCNGFDWDPENANGERCWLSGPWNGQWINGTAYGITHYVLIHGCDETSKAVPECRRSWKTTPNTQAYGGRLKAASTMSDCRTACVAEPGCDGFDWNEKELVGTQCWLTGAWILGWNKGTADGITHYKLIKDC